MDKLTFKNFSAANAERCASKDGFKHDLGDWSISDWFLAMTGEFGEAANVAKKLNRSRDGIPGNFEDDAELMFKLQRELADTFIYLDLLVQRCGFQLSEIVPECFDNKSAQIGYPRRLSKD